jgi:hypothetical protein
MKNYVVWTNCVIENPAADAAHGVKPADSAAYDEMYAISAASAKKYLDGTWEPVVFSDPAPSRVAMFQANWQRIWDLWHSEPCNILYLDSDTVFVRATQVFGRFEQFRLFNWTHPKSKHSFSNYFNAGVRYYPHTMSSTTWDIGQRMATNWDLNIWDQEQVIFNQMFWSQDLAWSDAHRADLNWQMPVSGPQDHDKFNGLEQSQAHIIHYHGTRGCAAAVKRARGLAGTAGVNT